MGHRRDERGKMEVKEMGEEKSAAQDLELEWLRERIGRYVKDTLGLIVEWDLDVDEQRWTMVVRRPSGVAPGHLVIFAR